MDATRGGLDVLLHYLPQARACLERPQTKFKLRPEEKTASATLYCVKKGGRDKWTVIDFGDEGRALDAIDVCKRCEGISHTGEAVLRIAALFGIKDDLRGDVNHPRVETRPAASGEPDGAVTWQFAAEIPQPVLDVLGPGVTAADAEALGWHLAEYVCRVKNGVASYKYSTRTYPILMRECRLDAPKAKEPACFYKIYEPLNPDKRFRFSYAPKGAKPAHYINGLFELKRECAAAAGDDVEGAGAAKLDAVFICSGERDALCCRSLGYHPVWFNSETYKITADDMAELRKYAWRVYNIPDIDETGVRKGRELALTFPDLCTIWLPESLREYRDNRGRPRKDLRDWMDYRGDAAAFKALISMAQHAQFWEKKKRGEKWQVDTEALMYFLDLSGFHAMEVPEDDDPRFVRVAGHVVTPVSARDLKLFAQEWARARCLPRAVRNLINDSPRMLPQGMSNLRNVELDFTNNTPTSQTLYFKNCEVTVTGEGATASPAGTAANGRYVWAADVLPVDFKELPPLFEITKGVGDILYDLDVKILDAASSPLFGYVINTCRLYWRKELETRWADYEADEQAAYAAANKFRIDGEGLTAEEIGEQKRNLLNKLFSIGYLLHRYKTPSRAWAPLAMDNKIGAEGECNGRSGKSFLFKALGQFMHPVTLSGRNTRLLENHFALERVTPETDLLLIDDCSRQFDLGGFYDMITGDIIVNPKHFRSFCIPFKDAPKIAFTTNYVPRDFSPSTEARLLYMVFSDYYHQRTTDNDYLETRSIRDDFGRDLYTDTYPAEYWNADANFLIQCLRFYLSICESGVKILPPMTNIEVRKLRAEMGENLEVWANTFFMEGGDNLDTYLPKREVYESFIRESKVNPEYYTMNRFTRGVRAFCELSDYIAAYNPNDLTGPNGRLQRRVGGQVCDVMYIRSMREWNARRTGGNPNIKTNDDASNNTNAPGTDTDGCPF